MGSIDELNAHLGLAREHCLVIKDLEQIHRERLVEIQARLIDVGSHVATPRKSDEGHENKINHTEFNEINIDNLETWIDEMDEKLPALKNFILPSGGLAAS
mmetsp:Transcript_20794/g.14905  ORF Transcript_20794/g.14905 Transcript_20794/m.14905 type:complete len:101 (+) Transcript_20794:205-507(+)